MGQRAHGGGGGERKVARSALQRPDLLPEVIKLENSERPEKRVKPAGVELSDALKPSTEETRTTGEGPEVDVGVRRTRLTELGVGKEVGDELAAVSELEDTKLRDDSTNLLEEAMSGTAEEVEELPHPGLGYRPAIATDTMQLPGNEPWRLDGTESREERQEKRKLWERQYDEMYRELRRKWRRQCTSI